MLKWWAWLFRLLKGCFSWAVHFAYRASICLVSTAIASCRRSTLIRALLGCYNMTTAMKSGQGKSCHVPWSFLTLWPSSEPSNKQQFITGKINIIIEKESSVAEKSLSADEMFWLLSFMWQQWSNLILHVMMEKRKLPVLSFWTFTLYSIRGWLQSWETGRHKILFSFSSFTPSLLNVSVSQIQGRSVHTQSIEVYLPYGCLNMEGWIFTEQKYSYVFVYQKFRAVLYHQNIFPYTICTNFKYYFCSYCSSKEWVALIIKRFF